MPLVTIIIPIYNVEKYLRKCLDSVVNQTYKNIEIILVNDCSPDNSEHIINSYAKIFKNIKVITNPINLGLSEARNLALSIANGDYIYFLDSDDWIKKDTIEKLVFLAKMYDVPLVSGNYKNVFSSQEHQMNTINTITYQNLERDKDLIKEKSGVVWNKLMKRSLIEDLRFPKGFYYEDNAFFYPLVTKAKKCVETSEIFYFYRRHLHSITISSILGPNEKILDIYPVLNCIKTSCKDLGTYEEYYEQINEIIKMLSIFPLLSINFWIQVNKQDKKQLLTILYQFCQNEYQFNDILDIDAVRKKMKQNKLYNLKLQLLLKQLDIQSKEEYTLEEVLTSAKRMITKYKR